MYTSYWVCSKTYGASCFYSVFFIVVNWTKYYSKHNDTFQQRLKIEIEVLPEVYKWNKCFLLLSHDFVTISKDELIITYISVNCFSGWHSILGYCPQHFSPLNIVKTQNKVSMSNKSPKKNFLSGSFEITSFSIRSSELIYNYLTLQLELN